MFQRADPHRLWIRHDLGVLGLADPCEGTHDRYDLESCAAIGSLIAAVVSSTVRRRAAQRVFSSLLPGRSLLSWHGKVFMRFTLSDFLSAHLSSCLSRTHARAHC